MYIFRPSGLSRFHPAAAGQAGEDLIENQEVAISFDELRRKQDLPEGTILPVGVALLVQRLAKNRTLPEA